MPNSTLALGVGCLLVMAVPASATITTEQALTRIESGDALQVARLVGATNGFTVANAWLAANQRPMLFCPPGKLNIMPEQVVQILRSYLVVLPAAANISAETVLLGAYQYTFPCSKPAQ